MVNVTINNIPIAVKEGTTIMEAAEKAANAKEYAAKRGIVEEETDSCMSGIPSRPYCKGRNYDPNRYND